MQQQIVIVKIAFNNIPGNKSHDKDTIQIYNKTKTEIVKMQF